MKKNLELILLIINWVIVAIQAFTIFLYGNSIGLFIIMLLALIAQVFSVYDNRKNRWENNFWLVYFGIAFIICGVFSVFACLDIAPCTELCGVYRAIGIIVWILVILWTLPPDTWLARFATNNYKRYEDNYD